MTLKILAKKSTFAWVFGAFLVLGMQVAQAAQLPFFLPYPHIDFNRWYISHGWVNGEHQSCEWRGGAISVEGNGLKFTLGDHGGKVRPLSCGEMHTNERTGYGVYEARIKSAAGSGLNTAFFTYVGPSVGEADHNEIDFEFLGKNPHSVQLNYYIHGKPQDVQLIALDYDASADFHDYSFVWEPTRIRWYIDGKQVYETKKNVPIPNNPGRIYMTLWSGTDIENAWLGKFEYTGPVSAEFAWVKYSPLH